jgi:hypothetical protein
MKALYNTCLQASACSSRADVTFSQLHHVQLCGFLRALASVWFSSVRTGKALPPVFYQCVLHNDHTYACCCCYGRSYKVLVVIAGSRTAAAIYSADLQPSEEFCCTASRCWRRVGHYGIKA